MKRSQRDQLARQLRTLRRLARRRTLLKAGGLKMKMPPASKSDEFTENRRSA